MSMTEKALRGISLEDFLTLVNLCCNDGTRSVSYLSDRNRLGNDIFWTHDIMGIPLRFDYYKALHPSFRLSGTEWSVSFKCTRSTQPRDISEYHDVRIGPLEREYTGWRSPPAPEKFYAYGFRRRGSLAQFRHHVSLLRLTL
jgi:hypothetical protein